MSLIEHRECFGLCHVSRMNAWILRRFVIGRVAVGPGGIVVVVGERIDQEAWKRQHMPGYTSTL